MQMQHLKGLEQLVEKLSSAMPDSVKHFQTDIENNLKSGLETNLQKMNLITREEFEIQSAVLLKTRKKVAELEEKLKVLESKLLDL